MLESFVGVCTMIVVHHTSNSVMPVHIPFHAHYLQTHTYPGREYLLNKKLARFAYSKMDRGLSHTIDNVLKSKLKERVGPEKAEEVDAMAFGTIGKCVLSPFSPYDSFGC